jgi:UDP-3-O-[3-hydroxymyristoyl] glucosamine N-acyltransferase
MNLGELAKKLGCDLEGDASLEITGVAGIEEAKAGELTFLVNRKYRPALDNTQASAILVARDAGPMRMAALRSANPYLDFARAIELFHPQPEYAPGIHPTAVIAESAEIGAGAHIGPYCYVDEGVRIGKNAVLQSFVAIYRGAKIGDNFFAHAHATVREGCQIGNRVLLQNGVVVGSDGFGFARQPDGHWYKMRQSGIAIIDDDARPWEKRISAAARRSTISCRSAMLARSAKIRCCAAR